MNTLYTNDGRFYIMLKPVGSWGREGCRHYALWRPVRRWLGLFWVRRGEDFWLDMQGFVKVEKGKP